MQRPSVNSRKVRAVRIALDSCIVRDWTTDDLAPLVRHANNRRVWINLRDRFPHPYLEPHGRQFLEHVSQLSSPTVWAIEMNGEAVGGIGLEPLTDVERISAEIGYWLGEPHWGRGVMTEVLRGVTRYAFAHYDLTRIFALPFADNPGSIRVLEKAGYVIEGRLRQSAIKDGVIRDQLLFAAYRDRQPR
jgi:RimJ/RimL family protein N-acetyltransferase